MPNWETHPNSVAMHQAMTELRAENESLKAMVKEQWAIDDALRKDAERYRWLRNKFTGEESIAANIELSFDEILVVHSSLVKEWPNAVDAAIDAAMKEQP